MKIYLDASVLVSLFVRDPLTERAQHVIRTQAETVAVSDWTLAEAASAIARGVRTGTLSRKASQDALATIDSWVATTADRLAIMPSDIRDAEAILRSFETTLRTPDALHVVVALRSGLALLTFDAAMSRNAHILGARLAV